MHSHTHLNHQNFRAKLKTVKHRGKKQSEFERIGYIDNVRAADPNVTGDIFSKFWCFIKSAACFTTGRGVQKIAAAEGFIETGKTARHKISLCTLPNKQLTKIAATTNTKHERNELKHKTIFLL